MHVKGEKNQCHGPWESCQENSLGFISSFGEFWKAFSINSIKRLSSSGVGRHVTLSPRILVSALLPYYHDTWCKIWHHKLSMVIQTRWNWEIRFLTCVRSSCAHRWFSHLCPVKAVTLRIGTLPLQDLETILCLTGPILNHTAVLEEGWGKQAKEARKSDPGCLPEVHFLQYTLCAYLPKWSVCRFLTASLRLLLSGSLPRDCCLYNYKLLQI